MAKSKSKKIKQKTLIYGGGAIGSFLAACLFKSNHRIYFLCRGKSYKEIKSHGLKIKVYNNSLLKKNIFLDNSENFQVINNLDKVKYIKFNNIFITTKINQNLKKIFKNIEKNISQKTLIITPCTSIPFWWHKCLNEEIQEKIDINLYDLFKKNIKRKNLVGMTMWLSGKIESPGNVKISHIQRGFPIKEVFKNKKKQVDKLRKDILKTAPSPIVRNIFSEIFIKSINSLAFNMIALMFNQNNLQLNNNSLAKEKVLQILNEGDNILKINNIRVYQLPKSRIAQTLKSKNHTMSMLNDFRTKKNIELKYLWLSFKKLCLQLKYNMKVTSTTYKQVEKKLDEYI